MRVEYFQWEGREGNEPWKIWGKKTPKGLLVEGLQLGLLEIRCPELILENLTFILERKTPHRQK